MNKVHVRGISSVLAILFDEDCLHQITPACKVLATTTEELSGETLYWFEDNSALLVSGYGKDVKVSSSPDYRVEYIFQEEEIV